MMCKRPLLAAVCFFVLCCSIRADEPAPIDTARGERMIAEYFRDQTALLRDSCLRDVASLQQWTAKRDEYRRQLLEMLGLDPLPEKTELHATITGVTERDEFRVERLHFQSRPGLYVTANLYLPCVVKEPLPAILYVCGHGRVKIDGVSYGNKVHYQHHGAWFARHGYVCLTIDTLQLGEIEGIHHGTYRENMWWWLNRGYTPAGVEAWNCIRALDYLQTRPEVDPERLGVTGRSGGGAYSWWIAAIDERIKAAVPVAGITDLQNHVVDGCVEGHCDCMYMVNTYRWDYPMVAALVAPRPLLISNTDSDGIFPLDGVVRTFEKVRAIYTLYGARDKVALNITAGPHRDTQELRVHAFRWLNYHLKDGDDRLIDRPAVALFEPAQLRVFDELPAGEQNSTIQEWFVPTASPAKVPKDTSEWTAMRDTWRANLLHRTFAGWPATAEPPSPEDVFSVEQHGLRFSAVDFTSQGPIRLRLYFVQRAGLAPADLLVLNAVDDQAWREFLATMRVGFPDHLSGENPPEGDEKSFKQLQNMLTSHAWCMAYVAPRGVGPTAWDQSEKKQIQHRRRFYLLGQTLEGMQVYDVRRAIQTLRTLDSTRDIPLWLQSSRQMAGVSLYASLFEPGIRRLDLYNLPPSHREGPFLLNVRRIFDMPEAVAMTAENSKVVIYESDKTRWSYPAKVRDYLGWDKKQLQIRQPPTE